MVMTSRYGMLPDVSMTYTVWDFGAAELIQRVILKHEGSTITEIPLLSFVGHLQCPHYKLP